MPTQESKIVNYRLFNPVNGLFKSNKNERASFKVVRCEMSDHCQAYALGKCATLQFMARNCSYGKVSREEGFTRRARKFNSWIAERREIVKDIAQPAGINHICEIGDFIYFPYAHWSLDQSVPCENRSGLFNSAESMIPKSRFTPEWFDKVLNAQPRAIMGGTIKSYQLEVVPKIVADTKRYAPGFFKEWTDQFPESAKRHVVTYVGRKARIKTIAPCKWTDEKGASYDWNGETVKVTGHSISFPRVSGQTAHYTIVPKDNATMIVTCDSQVTDETILV